MRKFLQQIIDYYAARPGGIAWHDITFVLPNKRSTIFLKSYVQKAITTVDFMPRTTTLTRMAEGYSTLPVADRRDQLFTLYNVYAAILRRRGHEAQLKDFDSFAYWGEMLLADFDDVDRSLSDPQKVFSNLRDVKEIQADYLDPEQKELVKALWGESGLTANVKRFWNHMPAQSEPDSMSGRFMTMWEILPELYESFVAELEQNGTTTAGRQLRQAAQTLKEMHPDDINQGRFVFVGFSEPSMAELQIFKRLQAVNKADFFWDVQSELFFDSTGRLNRNAPEARRLGRLMRHFPMPEGFELDGITDVTDIEVVAVPSNVTQAKLAGSILNEWLDEGSIDGEDSAALVNTAVILPDEQLLLPMLSAIPEGIGSVNITMRLPYNTTTFAALLKAVVSMQLRARKIRNESHFYYDDVKQLMANPYFQRVVPVSISDKLGKWIEESRLYNIPASELCSRVPDVAYIFRPVSDMKDVEEVHDYTMTLLRNIDEALRRIKIDSDGKNPARRFDLESLEFYIGELSDLGAQIMRHGIKMSQNTYFHLFERILSLAKIPLVGEPLRGLQVMGMLETRSLDFDNVIVLSMNERIMPPRNAMRSLIPENLRAAYCLPTRDDYDSGYAYHFYRLLTRAKRVKLLYDSRVSSNSKAGEVSRFITRLLYNTMCPHHIKVSRAAVKMPGSHRDSGAITVAKTPEVMAEVNRLRAGGNLSLSVAALKSFKKCPLQFYLQYVVNLRGEDRVTDYMADAIYGKIVHKVIEDLYTEYENKEITRATIDEMLAGDKIAVLVDATILKLYYNKEYSLEAVEDMPVEGRLVRQIIIPLVSKMLQSEAEEFCNPSFEFVKAEMKAPRRVWHVADGLDVNFKMSVDRVDRVGPGHLRFIDYKTGSDATSVSDIDELFTPEHDGDAILQLLAYCEVYRAMTGSDDAITPYVYPFRVMAVEGSIGLCRIGNLDVTDYHQVSDEFLPRLKSLVADIFDDSKPFVQCEKDDLCRFCPFITMCNRHPQEP